MIILLQGIARQLCHHFADGQGGPVMVGDTGGGGGAITIVGVLFPSSSASSSSSTRRRTKESRFLFADPHYAGPDTSEGILAGGTFWAKSSSFFKAGVEYHFACPLPPSSSGS